MGGRAARTPRGHERLLSRSGRPGEPCTRRGSRPRRFARSTQFGATAPISSCGPASRPSTVLSRKAPSSGIRRAIPRSPPIEGFESMPRPGSRGRGLERPALPSRRSTERAEPMVATASQGAMQGLGLRWWEHRDVPCEQVVQLLLPSSGRNSAAWSSSAGELGALPGVVASEGAQAPGGVSSRTLVDRFTRAGICRPSA